MSELKIALIGSAPSSINVAPYHDPEWQIWGCSPGTYGVMPRCNAFFELHLWEPGQPWFSPEYVQWLTALPNRGVTLWVGNEAVKTPIPGANVLPHQEIIDEFDPQRWFCTSSLFWMMAMAIKAGAKKIGLWGVDMAAVEEYQAQRSGIHHMAYIAKARGIEVGVPQESDLFTPRFQYGIDEWTHSFRKVRARRSELEHRRALAQQEASNKQQEAAFLSGAIDDLNYFGDTWVDKANHCGPTGVPKDSK